MSVEIPAGAENMSAIGALRLAEEALADDLRFENAGGPRARAIRQCIASIVSLRRELERRRAGA
jgi:hypothetical protein